MLCTTYKCTVTRNNINRFQKIPCTVFHKRPHHKKGEKKRTEVYPKVTHLRNEQVPAWRQQFYTARRELVNFDLTARILVPYQLMQHQ